MLDALDNEVWTDSDAGGATTRAAATPALNKVNLFTDPRFGALNLGRFRVIVPWDIIRRAERRASQIGGGPATCNHAECRDVARLNEYLRAVRRGPLNDMGQPLRANGLEPLISFGLNPQARVEAKGDIRRTVAPTPDTSYRSAVNSFRTYYSERYAENPGLYPRLKLFTAWNEPEVGSISPPNLVAEPERAARYLRQLSAACGDEGLSGAAGKCRVIAGDMTDGSETLDRPTTQNNYFKRYKAALKGYRPRIWGFHGYGCASALDPAGARDPSALKALARGTASGDSRADPRVWITEAGTGLFDRSTPTNDGNRPRDYAARLTDAEGDMRFLVSDCRRSNPRISRLYIYQWVGDRDADRDPATPELEIGFDTGLTDIYEPITPPVTPPRYVTRPTYDVLSAATP